MTVWSYNLILQQGYNKGNHAKDLGRQLCVSLRGVCNRTRAMLQRQTDGLFAPPPSTPGGR